jgi:hypothetical protein
VVVEQPKMKMQVLVHFIWFYYCFRFESLFRPLKVLFRRFGLTDDDSLDSSLEVRWWPARMMDSFSVIRDERATSHFSFKSGNRVSNQARETNYKW